VNSIALIRDNLRRSQDLVLKHVEDMKDHCMVFPTPRGGCHTLWVLGHLAYIEGRVVRKFMLGEANPLERWEQPFDGPDVSGDADDYPPFDEVLFTCREMRSSTTRLIDSMREDELDATSISAPSGYEDLFGTRRLCLQFVADHWYMHRGQLADARRAAGLTRMWL
jgi:hypothetical protein